MNWVLDLDGVVWRGDQPIAGSAAAVRRLQESGRSVVYVTNNASTPVAGYVEKLMEMNIEAEPTSIVNSGHALARLVKPGWKVLVVAGTGVAEAMVAAGAVPVMVDDVDGGEPPIVDAVVVGLRRDMTHEYLSVAVRAALQCGRLLAPNSDPLYPVANGVLMGGGSLATAVAYATNIDVQFAGKPYPAMVEAVRERIGDIEMFVGDQVETDGKMAELLSVPFALVHSGVTPANHGPVDVPLAIEGANLAEVVDRSLSTMVP